MSTNQSSRGPVPNPVKSFWNAESRPLDNHRTTPDLPSDADVVIIGSGFAGVATAYHILKDSSPSTPSIVLLEARTICSGATGRNGGHVKPDVYFNVPRYTKMYGAAAAAELAAFEAANVHAVKDLVEGEGLDCDFHITRSLDVYLDAEHAKQTEASYRELVKAGLVNLRDVGFIPKEDAERVTGMKGAQCAFSFTAAHLWPLKMVHQLLGKLLDKGLINAQANTPVSSVSSSRDDSGRYTVHTTRGTIKTPKVIYATNAYTPAVLPEYTDKIVPVRGTCSHIESPRGRDTPHLVNTYGIRFGGRPGDFDYLIPRADGSIVVGGARRRFWRNRSRYFGTTHDDELIDEAVSYFDGYMQRHFRGWEDSQAKTSKVWTGIMGYSSDFVPHVGEVPDKPGQFIIAGFSGHGMPAILLSSKGLAAMVRDGVPFEQSGVPRVFRTSKERITQKTSPLEESMRPLFEGEQKAKL